MKAIKLTSVAVLATIALSGLATQVQAADVTYGSKGSVAYTPFTGVTPPVDPTDPAKPVDPENPDGSKPGPGTGGALSIDFASSFDFGKQEITSSTKTYNAAAQKLADGTTRPNYVQVTDNRGNLAGWSLSVKQEAQFKVTDSTVTGAGSELTAASMTLGGGNIVSTSKDAAADKAAITTTLIPGTQSPVVLGATAGHGAGTNLLVFGKDASQAQPVTLVVPGSTTKLAKAYSTNLTWTLSDTPA